MLIVKITRDTGVYMEVVVGLGGRSEWLGRQRSNVGEVEACVKAADKGQVFRISGLEGEISAVVESMDYHLCVTR